MTRARAAVTAAAAHLPERRQAGVVTAPGGVVGAGVAAAVGVAGALGADVREAEGPGLALGVVGAVVAELAVGIPTPCPHGAVGVEGE